MDLGLAGAKALVQGGTKGIGRAAAECLAADGASVAVMARTPSELDATVEALRRLGAPEALGLRADITKLEEGQAALGLVAERFGHLNILINAAGPGKGGYFDELSDAEWQVAIDSGAMGMIRCVRAALPLLRKAEWARIVNVSAHSTKRQTASLVAYTAAKAMVTSVTKNLSLSLAKDEILVSWARMRCMSAQFGHTRNRFNKPDARRPRPAGNHRPGSSYRPFGAATAAAPRRWRRLYSSCTRAWLQYPLQSTSTRRFQRSNRSSCGPARYRRSTPSWPPP
jgi:NAD(P)-dependent dehydrogenase (short-subunit alcohol dehydrogenase family)